MYITATELKENLGKYLNKSLEEEIYITKNGKVISKLSNPFKNRTDIAKSLFGVVKSDISIEEIKEERTSGI